MIGKTVAKVASTDQSWDDLQVIKFLRIVVLVVELQQQPFTQTPEFKQAVQSLNIDVAQSATHFFDSTQHLSRCETPEVLPFVEIKRPFCFRGKQAINPVQAQVTSLVRSVRITTILENAFVKQRHQT
jgi:hypothetical protein